MRTITQFLLFLFLLSSLQGKTQYFTWQDAAGNVSIIKPCDQGHSFTIHVLAKGDYNDNKSYSVSFSGVTEWVHNTETSGPFNFSLPNSTSSQSVEISVAVPLDASVGSHTLCAILTQTGTSYWKSFTITINVYKLNGDEDYVYFTNAPSVFSEGDPLVVTAAFDDEQPTGDDMDYWDLDLTIQEIGNLQYSYKHLNEDGYPYHGSNITFNFNAPSLPSGVSFPRNINGNIVGEIKISGEDTYNSFHSDQMSFEITKEPDPVFCAATDMLNNGIYLKYHSYGATSSEIYYGTHSGTYDGTCANQGVSPISVGNASEFYLDGFTKNIPYYFSVKGLNANGSTNYSEERKIYFFDAPNSLNTDYFFDNYVVEENYSLPTKNYYFTGDIIIESGAELSCNGGILYFNENSKIIIEPGGKLTLDGTICTAPCGNDWQGIQVWGKSSFSQYVTNGVLNQGLLVIKNHGGIQNAHDAITLSRPGVAGTGGGIIHASDADFVNNRRATEFISYHNFHPITHKKMDNGSFFKNCSFETNNEYIVNSPFSKFITMWDVEGVKIEGCSFKNSKTITSSDQRGMGIYTEDASYYVRKYCSSLTSPCPSVNQVPCTFEGLYAGIYSLVYLSLKTVSIQDATFTKNSYGVKLKAIKYPLIIRNNFDLGPNTNCPDYTGIGIQLNQCDNYIVEQNSFDHTLGGPSNANYVGIDVCYDGKDGKVQNNIIYNNRFKSGITIGNQAEGDNIDLEKTVGLHYECNDHTSNKYDIYVSGKGIAKYQGNDNAGPGNCFSSNNYVLNINNEDADIAFIYYSHEDVNCKYVPQPNDVSYVFLKTASSNRGCPDNYPENGNPVFFSLSPFKIDSLGVIYANLKNPYDSINSRFVTLNDNGNSDSLVNLIRYCGSKEVLDLISNLNSVSPYLSYRALYSLIDRTDVINDRQVRDILGRNPDELSSNSLLIHLKDARPLIADSTIQNLRNSANTITTKTTLLKDLSSFDMSRRKVINLIINGLLHDTVSHTDTLKYWLRQNNNISSDLMVADLLMEEGNTSEALQLIDSIPAKYTLNSSEYYYFQYYFLLESILGELVDEGETIFEMDSTQIADIENIALRGGNAGARAENILQSIYSNPYELCPAIPVNNSENAFSIAEAASAEIIIKVFPNPSSLGHVTFLLQKNDINDKIEIYNSQQALIKTIEPVGLQTKWCTIDLSSGLYIYKYYSSGTVKTGKIILL